MKHRFGDEQGSIATILSLALLGVGFVAALGFAVWAFSGRQDYKNNVETKIAAAVQANTKKVQKDDAAAYAEQSKNPMKTYVGPEQFGTVSITYPKTWSAYVVTGNSAIPLDLYVHPDVVPSINADTSNFALRVQVVDQKYSTVLQQFVSQQKQQKVTAQPFVLPKVPGVTGIRFDGQISQNKQGSMVVLPVRDKTLKIWTESSAYLTDFNEKVLPNASFVR